ncbi:tryptophanyl-tRNA synthetase [Mycena floridula]|nr:tryptophanyl-tRNA synthetase [Mycena floridula]
MHALRRPARRFCLAHFSTSVPQFQLKKRVVFSGIQPTGIPHLGNYLGALSNWVTLQKNAAPEDTLLFSIVGWHALTLPQDPKQLAASRMEMLAALLAIGIDPKRAIVFHQDQNANHTELAWILSCLAPMGKLRRMTTWKARLMNAQGKQNLSELEDDAAGLNVGLFTYPILQAADILLYKSTDVPVGHDQTQHIELCNDLADQFNRTFKFKVFPLPSILITPSKRILSLRDPTSKMSKSAPLVSSRILLTDNASEIRSKIRSAVTDSLSGITFDSVNRPGVANLLTILAACEGTTVEVVAERYLSKNHSDLKGDVVEAVDALLSGPRAEFARLRDEKTFLAEMADEGVRRAKIISERTMIEVKSKIGLS